jgi:hypothetical protein
VLASAVISTILWRELHTERQTNADLRLLLTEAQAALAAKPQPQPAALPAPAAATVAATVPPPAPPAKTAVQAASAVLMADSAQRQKKLLEDAEFRKARIAQIRSNIQLRSPNLARDLGLSPQEADALMTMVAEYQVRQEAFMTDAMAGGTTPDAAAIAELNRTQREMEQQHRSSIAALLGAERGAAFQEYQETASSRQRVTNLTNILNQAGKPLTSAQSKSLAALLVEEQRRQESDSRVPPTAGQPRQSQADRTIESDRRVLAGAASFLDAQQIEVMRARFEQVAARNRASASVQQREMEAARGAGNAEPPAAATP